MRPKKQKRVRGQPRPKASRGDYRACDLYPTKVRYKDHASAVEARMVLERQVDRPIPELRIYDCACHGYHLTRETL